LLALCVCALSETVQYNNSCAFHRKYTNSLDDGVTQQYFMMNDSLGLGYYRGDVYSQDGSLSSTEYLTFRPNETENGEGFVVYSDHCEGTGSIVPLGTSFDYTDAPETEACPNDGSKMCTKYSYQSNPHAPVTGRAYLDEYMRIVAQCNPGLCVYYTYYDDAVTADLFSVNCEGSGYTAIDLCGGTTSSSSQSSSSSSEAGSSSVIGSSSRPSSSSVIGSSSRPSSSSVIGSSSRPSSSSVIGSSSHTSSQNPSPSSQESHGSVSAGSALKAFVAVVSAALLIAFF